MSEHTLNTSHSARDIKRLRWHIDRYVNRYFPSRKQLEQWACHRFKDEESLVLDILNDFMFPYEETDLIRSWITRLLDAGKSRRFIFLRLLRKWFPESVICECMDAFQDKFSDEARFDLRIQRRIDTLIARKKSSRAIIADVSRCFPDIRTSIASIVHQRIGPFGGFDQQQLFLLFGSQKTKRLSPREYARYLRLWFDMDTIRSVTREGY